MFLFLFLLYSCTNPSVGEKNNYDTHKDSIKKVDSINNQKIELIKLKKLYIGKSILVDSLEVAEFDLPEGTTYIDAFLICQKLGDGWRLPSKSEMISIYNNSRVKNLEIGTPNSGTYWINEFKDVDKIPIGQLQTATYLVFYYNPPKVDEGYVGGKYKVRLLRKRRELISKNDSLNSNTKYVVRAM